MALRSYYYYTAPLSSRVAGVLPAAGGFWGGQFSQTLLLRWARTAEVVGDMLLLYGSIAGGLTARQLLQAKQVAPAKKEE